MMKDEQQYKIDQIKQIQECNKSAFVMADKKGSIYLRGTIIFGGCFHPLTVL